jgi:hypothetical protein
MFPAKIQFCSVQSILIAYAKFDYPGRELSEKLLLENWIGLGTHLGAPRGSNPVVSKVYA